MCYFRVVDAQTKRLRKCRGANVRTRGGLRINICWMHTWDPAAKIQAAWRQYKTRKTVAAFKTLPSDLWSEVLCHIERRNKVPELIRSHRKIYEYRCNRALRSLKVFQDVDLSHEEEHVVTTHAFITGECVVAHCRAIDGMWWCDRALEIY